MDSKAWYENNIEPYYTFKKAHNNSVETVIFNPVNFNELISGSHDQTIKIWDIQKFQQTQTLKGHKEGVWATTFTPDGKFFFSGSPDKTILLWDLKKGKPVSQLKEHKNKVYWVKTSNNGQLMVSGGEDGQVIEWDLKKLKFLKVLQVTQGIVYSTMFTPDGKYLVCCDSQGIIKIYDTNNYNLKAQTLTKPRKNERVYCCDVYQQEGLIKIIAGYQNNFIKQWNFDPKSEKINLDFDSQVHLDSVQSIQVHQSLKFFATGARDGCGRVWSFEREHGKDEVIANLLGHGQNIARLCFMPMNSKQQQTILATGSWDQNINLYKI